MHIEEKYLYFTPSTLILCRVILFRMQFKCKLGQLCKNVEKSHISGFKHNDLNSSPAFLLHHIDTNLCDFLKHISSLNIFLGEGRADIEKTKKCMKMYENCMFSHNSAEWQLLLKCYAKSIMFHSK